jgi:membrane protease YdiL (CAAX protease family)
MSDDEPMTHDRLEQEDSSIPGPPPSTEDVPFEEPREQVQKPTAPVAAAAGFTTAGGAMPRRFEIHPVAFGFIVAGLVFGTYQILGGIVTYLIAGAEVTDRTLQPMRLLTMGSQFVFLMLPAVLALRMQGWPLREALKLRVPRIRELILASIGVLCLQFMFQSYSLAQEHVVYHYLVPDSLLPLFKKFNEFIEGIYLKLMAMHSPGEMLFVMMVVALTPAFCEEILFRGVVQDAFRRGMRLRWAFLLTAGIFALFHLNPMSFVPIVVLSLYFSILVWRTGSIVVSMAAHAVNNGTAVLSLYFGRAGTAAHDIMISPSFTTSVWLGAAGLVVFVPCMIAFWRITRPARETPPVSVHQDPLS